MKILKILFLFALSVFLISTASATMVVYGSFGTGTQHSATITNGQSITLYSDFGTSKSSMTISAKLYNSNGNLVYTFLDQSFNVNVYQPSYSLTPAIYLTTGNYELILTGTDSNSADSDTLYLTVNAIPPPANHAPVITTTPITSVNEGNAYSYDVNATDADNNTLTYSLTIAPTWLSINSSTGLISGIAPIVTSNSINSVFVRVSDGIDATIQSYTLTVIDIPVIGNAPVITILGTNPITVQAGSVYIDSGATATDVEDGNLTANITKISNVNVNILGNYSVIYSVTDSANNTVTATRNVSVIDTTSPVITLNGANTLTITQNGAYTELGATALDNLDGFLTVNITGNVNTSVIGTYTITYTATDSHGNSATPKTRTVNIVSSGSSSSGSSVTGKTVYSYIDVYNDQYQAQLNHTNPKIDLGGQETPSKGIGNVIFWIILAILILGILIAFLILALGRENRVITPVKRFQETYY